MLALGLAQFAKSRFDIDAIDSSTYYMIKELTLHRQVTGTSEPADSILAKQRRNRPVAPHLTIYKPQVTWIPSAMNRVTGVILSGSFYIFGLSYLAAPAFGWHLESAVLAASFASWPFAAKVLAKFALAWPFTFHSFNGLRHLTWDFGKQITNKQVQVTGWTVIGVSFVSAIYLAAFV